MAKDAKRVYPHAVSLMETVRTYGQTLDLVERNKGIEWLVAEYRNEALRMISRVWFFPVCLLRAVFVIGLWLRDE